MLVWAFGRCPSVNLDLLDGDVLVAYHNIKRISNLTQLLTVVHVVGTHLPLVHNEVDKRRAMQLTGWLAWVRHYVVQHHEVVWIGWQQCGKECLFVLHLVATAAEVALNEDVCRGMPWLISHCIGIGILLWCAVIAAYEVAVINVKRVNAIAFEDDVLASAADDECLQTCLMLSVLGTDDRRESTIAVAGHVELVENEVHGNHGALGGACHLYIIYSNLCVGTFLGTCQADGLLSRELENHGQ